MLREVGDGGFGPGYDRKLHPATICLKIFIQLVFEYESAIDLMENIRWNRMKVEAQRASRHVVS